MSTQTLVSIAIPAFSAEFFRRTLISALGQDYPALEVVVCDDSSGAEIEAICDELGKAASASLRYVRNPERLGFARNLLTCLSHCSGTLIKFLCDDDTLASQCIRLQANVLVEHADVSVVIAQRLLCDGSDILLPSRLLNCLVSPETAVLNGGDLLAYVSESMINLFGGISHAMYRRAQVEEVLAALVQDGQGFSARLDLALCVCLLRRGHLASLNQILSLERIHAGRLSHQAVMTDAMVLESDWLSQMLAARTTGAPPAEGYVRLLPLKMYRDDTEQQWQEIDVRNYLSKQNAAFKQQIGTQSLDFSEVYAEWLACRAFSEGQLLQLPKRIERWPSRPRIMPVVMCRAGDEVGLRNTLDSLEAQSYPADRIMVLADTDLPRPSLPRLVFQPLHGEGFEQVNTALSSKLDADWIVLLQAGDRMHPHALVILAERMALRTDASCLYWDEGVHDGRLSSEPTFKPDFNLDLMRSIPYVGRQLAFKRESLIALGGFDTQFAALAPHDLLWRMVEAHGLQVVEHIAEVLVQARQSCAEWVTEPKVQEQSVAVVHQHLSRLGVNAHVAPASGPSGLRVRYFHERPASVSIVIHVVADLLMMQRCVESLVEHTRYPAYELLLVSSGNEPLGVRNWLAAMDGLGGVVRIIGSQAYDRARCLNHAVEFSRCDYLLLLDAGCVLFDEQWLDELMMQAQRPEVGIVGPAIHGRDGAVVAGALVLGLRGVTGSPVQGSVSGIASRQRLCHVQNWSALSLECLLVRRELYVELQGLDADSMADNLDADLCLRAREQGYLVVWTPFSKVIHWPASDAVPAPASEGGLHRQAFYQRWLAMIARDPAYNPNLSLAQGSFSLEPGLRGGWDPFIARVLPSVLALPFNTTGVGHYRVIQPFTELERAGWIQGRLGYHMPSVIEAERQKPDAMILQLRYAKASIEEISRLKQFSSARRIFEIDDYIIEPPKKNDHVRNWPSDIAEQLSRAVGLCDRLVVSTEPLADALSNMHQDIRIVPNMLAPGMWTGLVSSRQTSAKPRVGWAGGTSHRGDLELMLDVVKALANEVDWVFFGMCPEILRPFVKEFHKGVPLDLYPQKLASLNLDLALAPLEQNLFNDCKSNLRLLEYGACGFPVICTDTKAYAGYLPCTRVRENSPEQWLDAIRMHLSDPQASYRQGDALRAAVLRDYVLTPHHLQHWANAWLAD
ncbi:glycosyltransferase [Pseudomonas juntendi]|uniref:Glycosyltransferase n=1 Tax=Pseudomonas juntendi TaxID=2666183 RepID=A0A7W2JIH3_9PSED|nr:glycosyltransferase [Pseudomonas juntendi]MBA6059596.1 glycosyltransferase [Pseudomonas juntendi]MBA6125880.1 glycosyltransferase [Pseudomonas juntendi]